MKIYKFTASLLVLMFLACAYQSLYAMDPNNNNDDRRNWVPVISQLNGKEISYVDRKHLHRSTNYIGMQDEGTGEKVVIYKDPNRLYPPDAIKEQEGKKKIYWPLSMYP